MLTKENEKRIGVSFGKVKELPKCKSVTTNAPLIIKSNRHEQSCDFPRVTHGCPNLPYHVSSFFFSGQHAWTGVPLAMPRLHSPFLIKGFAFHFVALQYGLHILAASPTTKENRRAGLQC